MRMKTAIKHFLAISVVIFICTACANSTEPAVTQEAPESEPQYIDVELGHFIYSVPDYCDVMKTESEVALGDHKTVNADGYVIRSFCMGGVPVELEEAIEVLYPGESFEYTELGQDNTAAYLMKTVSANSDGTPMYVYGYHFMSEDFLHVFGIWSYTEKLSEEAQNVIATIEKTYTTLADEQQRIYEEEEKKVQQAAIIEEQKKMQQETKEEYYKNQEWDNFYEDSYHYDGSMRSRR